MPQSWCLPAGGSGPGHRFTGRRVAGFLVPVPPAVEHGHGNLELLPAGGHGPLVGRVVSKGPNSVNSGPFESKT